MIRLSNANVMGEWMMTSRQRQYRENKKPMNNFPRHAIFVTLFQREQVCSINLNFSPRWPYINKYYFFYIHFPQLFSILCWYFDVELSTPVRWMTMKRGRGLRTGWPIRKHDRASSAGGGKARHHIQINYFWCKNAKNKTKETKLNKKNIASLGFSKKFLFHFGWLFYCTGNIKATAQHAWLIPLNARVKIYCCTIWLLICTV